MLKSLTHVILIFFSLFYCISSYGSSSQDSSCILKQRGNLFIGGGTSHIPFMQELASEIMSHNFDFKITISGGGSGIGLQKLGSGLIDIANTGKALTKEEMERFQLRSFAVAYDAITFIVHPQNPISNLSRKELQNIFSGKIRNWKDLKQNYSGNIHVYTRNDSSGTQDILLNTLLRGFQFHSENQCNSSQADMRDSVTKDPQGIGFISMAYLNKMVKAVKVDGYKVSQENILSKHYPFIRTLFVNVQARPNQSVKSFLDCLKSQQGAEIILKAGFIPTYFQSVSQTPKNSEKQYNHLL